jgi:lysophospholipase L1-like esterase
MDREPSKEELQLIDDKPENYKAHFKLTTEAYKQWYRVALKNICDELNIEYIDLNHFFPTSEKSSQWLFIDNVHFHDQGSALAAEIISKECSFM